MNHPNEPIWFEMAHRLHGILRRQGRRAERRKKRRLRSKLLRGKSKNGPRKRDEGKELREYLDRQKAENEAHMLEKLTGGRNVRELPSEFLSKVHENYLLHQERAESQPYRFRSAG